MRLKFKTSRFSPNKFSAMLFVIALGLGDKITLFGIRVIYIALPLYVLLNFRTIFRAKIGINTGGIYSRIIAFGLLWVVYSFVTILYAVDMERWKSSYISLVINFLTVFMIVKYIRSWNDWLWIAKSVMVLLALMIAVGLMEILTGNHIQTLDFTGTFSRWSNRPLTFYGNINDNASALILCVIVLFYLCAFYRKRWSVFVGMIVTGIVLWQVYVDGSRASLLALTIFVGMTIFFQLLNKVKSVQAHNIFMVLFFAVLVSLIFMLSINPAEYYLGIFFNAHRYNGSDYLSDLRRIAIIKEGFEGLLHTFGMGLGPGQSVTVVGINQHNFLTEVIFEYGIFIGGYFFYQLFKICFRDKYRAFPGISAMTRAIPFTLVMLGLSSSHFFSIRMTWVVITLVFTLVYGNFPELQNEKNARNNQIYVYSFEYGSIPGVKNRPSTRYWSRI